MKVLFYTYEYPPLGGGVANAVFHLLQEFKKYPDLEMDVVTSALDNKYSIEKYSETITIHRIPMGERRPENYHRQKASDMILFTWQAFRYTWKLIFQKKYDFNHFFGFPGGAVSFLFRWRMPYILSLRGIETPGYSPKFGKWYLIYKPWAWIFWKLANKVITNSYALSELAKKTVASLDYQVIPNGVDIERFKPAAENEKFKQFSVTAGGTVLGKIKGLDYLIKGFARLQQDFPEIQLKLIGNGDMEQELRELVIELQISEQVEFLGRQPHEWIEQNLGKFHVLCLPSLNEGMSNAMLEGLAAGLPLVITNTGGTKEILTDGENGIIVKQKDSDSIYFALKRLYLNPELRQTMGRASRKRAESMSWQQVAESYYNLYKQQVTNE